MTELRRVEPIDLGDLVPRAPVTGMPIAEYVDPRDLWIDPTYQRDIGDKGVKQIARIITEFDWTRYAPPICTYEVGPDGATILKCVDGQHRAIACASNPHVEKILVVIVETPDQRSQAGAFVSQNRDRLAVTPLQLHHAAVAAGDEDAQTVAQVCDRAGVRLLRYPNSSGRYEPGETMAISAIKALVARRNALGARKVLELLVSAGCAPLTLTHIRAAELLLNDPEFCGQISTDELISAIEKLRPGDEIEAKAFSKTHCVPLWRGLASIWFKGTRKRRAPPATTNIIPVGNNVQNAPAKMRTIVPHQVATQRVVTSAVMGDPEPGRSALDQRRQA